MIWPHRFAPLSLVLVVACLAETLADTARAAEDDARGKVQIRALWTQGKDVSYGVEVLLHRPRTPQPVNARIGFAEEALTPREQQGAPLQAGVTRSVTPAMVLLTSSAAPISGTWSAPRRLRELACTGETDPVTVLAFAIKDEPRLRRGDIPLTLSVAEKAAPLCVAWIQIRPIVMDPGEQMDALRRALGTRVPADARSR